MSQLVSSQTAIKFARLSPFICQQCFARRVNVKTIERDITDFHSSASSRKAQRLYCWGYAVTGALGEITNRAHKRAKSVHKPIRKQSLDYYRIDDIACGFGFSLYAVRSENRKLYGSGLNTDSQIGFQCRRGPRYPLTLIRNNVPIRLPIQKPKETNVIKVAAGRAHSLALTDNEGVFSFGNNDFGQCGRSIVKDETYNVFKNPWRLKPFEDERIIDIVCGQDHSLFLTESGKVYSCGNGADGQTGLGSCRVVEKPTLVGGDIQGEKIIKLSSACDTVLALNDKGEIFGWGNNEYFQLRLIDAAQQLHTPTHLKLVNTLGKILDVAASGTVSMVLTENHDVYVWGYGILGKGPKAMDSEEPTCIPNTLFGRSSFHPDTKVTSIQCGVHTKAAITNRGELYMWGSNKLGQLGLGHRTDQYFPIRVSINAFVKKVSCGLDHTMALCKPLI